jgi:hypothetical protein
MYKKLNLTQKREGTSFVSDWMKKVLFVVFTLFISSIFGLSFAQDGSIQVGPIDTVNVATPQPSFFQKVGNYFSNTVEGLTQGARSAIDNFYNNNTPGPGVPNAAIGDKVPIFTPTPDGDPYSFSNSNILINDASSYGISCNVSNLRSISDVLLNLAVGCILNPLVYIIISLAVIVFLWGVIKFVISENEGDKQKGKEFILWGIVGLFVMISIWGLENILASTFVLNNGDIHVREVSIPLR